MTDIPVAIPPALPGWPLFGLRLRCRGVELRLAREGDLRPLAELMPADVEHDPHAELLGGLDREANRRRLLYQTYWRSLGTWSPSSWYLDFAVTSDGALVGMQSLEADQFPVLRTVDTASWLATAARGRGIGVAMRMAVLGLAFDNLGAEAAITAAVSTNAASLGVSRRIGYQPNGLSFSDSEQGRIELTHLRLTAGAWRASGLGGEVSVRGLEPGRPWFGPAT
jgi:RimJ/RimL family protein N-acetyltransferase